MQEFEDENVDDEIEESPEQDNTELPEEFVISDDVSKPESDEAPEEESEEEEKPKKRGRVPAKTRINELTRETYRERAEKEALAQRNRELENRLKEVEAAANRHYEKRVESELKEAREETLKAIDSSDAQGLIAAQEKLAEAKYAEQELRRAEAYKARDNVVEKQQAEYQQVEQQRYYQPSPDVIQQWRLDNPWADDESDEFNPELTNIVHDIADELHSELEQAGSANVIGSVAYFHEINKRLQPYARQVQANPRQQQPNRRTLQMAKSKQSVSSVRGGGGTATRGTQWVVDREEADWIKKILKVEPGAAKYYRKAKEEMDQERKMNRGGYN